MIEVYRGSPNTWECDEMGHMNVRFYVARMMEGLAWFACEAGLPHAFRSGADSTLAPTDQHIRYMREARPGAPLVMRACVTDITDTGFTIYQQLDHLAGEACAVFRTRVSHIETQTRQPFAWSADTRSALERFRGTPPDRFAPRSIDIGQTPASFPHVREADAIGAPEICRGVVAPQHCDHLGYMAPEFVMGRVSDSITNLMSAWREEVVALARARGEKVETGAAVLEQRLVYRRMPRIGDRIAIRSALAEVGDKTQRLVHWLVDPSSGELWASIMAVSVTFNLLSRKVISTPPEQAEALRRLIPSGLAL